MSSGGNAPGTGGTLSAEVVELEAVVSRGDGGRDPPSSIPVAYAWTAMCRNDVCVHFSSRWARAEKLF